MRRENSSRPVLLASRQFTSEDNLSRVVDFLNKSLKERDLVFGLAKGPNGTLKISIYKM